MHTRSDTFGRLKWQSDTDENEITDAGTSGIGASLSWTKHMLCMLGVRVHEQSGLAQSFAALERLMGTVRTQETVRYKSPQEAQQKYFLSNGADFLTKALQKGFESGLRGFDGHYNELASANPVTTSPDGASSSSRAKAWELLLANLVSTIAKDVRPEEPDVVCTFEGRRTGLAAKMLYSRAATKQLERIREGARQLENSNVEEGYVAVNLVELFPHGKMFELFQHARFDQVDEIVNVMDVWMNAFMAAHGMDRWARQLKDSEKLLAVLFFLPTVLHVNGLPTTLVPYYRVHYASVAEREARCQSFLWRLNEVCQKVLHYRPTVASVSGS